ncbi:MAG: IclR family transcriptional regulator [Alphaproteobacteria bacterium]|nr:IclR family transcriptional regulator [Alphaproteobacteria bacterium]
MDSVQSIARAASLLRAIAQSGRGGARLTELAKASALSKSTAHRILGALKQVGLVEQSADAGLFHLGVEAFALGAVAANRHRLADLAQPSMVRLAERTADTIYLTVRVGLDGLCIERREGSFPIKTLTLEVGGRLPLGVGAGNLAMLAGLSDDDVARALERTAPQVARYPNLDIGRIRAVVEAARRHGHTFVETLYIPGMSAVGVAIAGRDGVPIAALSVAAITSRMRAERRANVIAWLKSEARAVEAALNQTGGDGGLRRAAASRGRGR